MRSTTFLRLYRLSASGRFLGQFVRQPATIRDLKKLGITERQVNNDIFLLDSPIFCIGFAWTFAWFAWYISGLFIQWNAKVNIHHKGLMMKRQLERGEEGEKGWIKC